jgi:hypothetical protein
LMVFVTIMLTIIIAFLTLIHHSEFYSRGAS